MSFFYLFIFFILSTSKIFIKENTIEVKTFFDYAVDMALSETLNIKVPQDTFLIISSKNGYRAFAYNSIDPKDDNIIGEMNPNTQDRLIYFQNEGLIKVTSTVASLKFIFHTLPIKQINNIDIKSVTKYLVVSTNPNEKYNYGVTHLFSNISYEQVNHTFWFLSNRESNYLSESNRYDQILYYATSSDDESKEITLTKSEKEKNIITGKSKLLFYGINMDSRSNIYFHPETENEADDNYYTDYRVIIDLKNLIGSQIIQRGKDRTKHSTLYVPKDNNIIEFDFTMTEEMQINNENDQSFFLIFPYLSNTAIYKVNDVYGYHYTKKELSYFPYLFLDSVTAKETEMHFKALIFPRVEDYHYVISTCPTEKFVFDNFANQNANYSNDVNGFYYVMASLQDIETTIIYEGSVSFYAINNEKNKKIEVESGGKISGPFIASIKKDSICNFTTFPKSDLKEGYNDNFRGKTILVDEIYFFHKKYGIYQEKNLPIDESALTGYSFHNFHMSSYLDAVKIKSKCNLFYIHEQYGWKVELIDSNLKEQYEIGPHLGITSWYVFNDTINAVHEFILYNLVKKAGYSVTIEYAKTYISHETQSDECDKVVLFNDLSPTYKIITNNETGAIQMNATSILCMIPVARSSEIESTISNEGTDALFYFYGFKYNGCHVSEKELFGIDCPYLRIKNVNPSMEIDIKFIPYTDIDDTTFYYNDIQFGEPVFYSEFNNIKEPGVYLIKNANEEKEEIITSDEFQISDHTGLSIVDMSNKEAFIIKCPKYSIVFVHNTDDIFVEGMYTNKTVFGTHYGNSTDRIICFSDSEGEVKITKRSSSVLKIYFSYLLFRYEYNLYPYEHKCEDAFMTTDPNSYFKMGDFSNESIGNEKNSTLKDYLCFWFSSPNKFDINVNNLLLDNLDAHYRGKYFTIQENAQAKDNNFLFLFRHYYYPTNKSRYVEFKSESEIKLMDDSVSNNFAVQSIYFSIPETNSIVSDSIIDTDKPDLPTGGKNDDKDNDKMIIIIVVVCLVVVVIIIAIIITVIIIKKKRKQKDLSSISEDESPGL
ncbi:hypothetical protein M9Y10_006319 [Tritrichomonas musculus]|uniref:Uncharacterized protein n=1 Tax=Tritrichomonas musculus TaxID=1915356 RepID=A0ABR2JFE5_9EUKA